MAPEDRAKQNMAKSLFGGLKGPKQAPAPVNKVNDPQPPKKKTEKV